MYLPRAFQESRPERLHALMREYPFATLMAFDGTGSEVVHLPLELDGNDRLTGHVARANALSRMDGATTLAIFHGPQGYVSPNWYPSQHETGREVPTWNYAVVHVHGRLRLIDDAAWLRDLLERLTDRQESTQPEPWRVADAPADHTDRLLKAIIGVEIAIERIEGKFKLNQNHPSANRAGVIDGLRRRSLGQDRALADLMAQAGTDAA